MKIRRSYLFALLLPLLLVFFSCRPFASAAELSCCEQEAVEVLEGFRDAEERVEEEENVFFSCLLQRFDVVVIAPAFGDSRHFFSTLCCASSLALGCMIPLRI
jgi:hypothetical protein